ncbi:SARP family transcriptional regulator [Virgisporangium aurantiacum]|uniref:SARP family transcriptional regulator n=1 Tax=Virgisporangium aurantiacum TaxID=175570 RepID=A0A8J3Z8T6_9ACTN|nr:SARP family transcriptional regulator [Virgisporangium aurantiacum]
MGAIEASVDGRPVPLAATKVRALLAVLACRRDQPLDRDWLVDAMWPVDPPHSARQTLAHYVWRLRRLLADEAGQVIRSVPDGYRLAVGADDVDAAVFERRAAAGRAAAVAGDVASAIDELSAALALWRGPALAGVLSVPVLAEAAQALDKRRWDVTEAWAELCLEAEAGDADAGRGNDLVPALEHVVAVDPYRERAWRLLLLALARAGRRPEALAAYRRMWRTFTDGLGIEPGTAVRDVHARLLAEDKVEDRAGNTAGNRAELRSGPRVAPPVPRQLPAAGRHFVNRSAELAQLAHLVTETAAVPIGAMSGTAGVGKSALALHFAQRVAADFPDGQLYLNLRGFDPAGQPVGPAEAIRSLLAAFGVVGPPGDLDAQAALYRSTLAGRRLLVLLDNARDTDQVRPLLPGTPGCLVLVTSRSQLTGLAAEGALLITLGLFSADVSRELLARHLGAGRVTRDADAARVIVERCARLPLALTTVGARAAAHPTFPLARFADELTDAGAAGRLDVLDAGDSATRTRAVFSWSYRFLGAPTARLFRLLGVHTGPDIALPAAAGLAGAPAARVRPLLAELARLHLIGEDRPGRFAFHDLLRAYADELARATDSAEERRAALLRVSVHYVHTGIAAAQLIDPGRQPPPLAPLPDGVEAQPLHDYAGAIAWFDAEWPILVRMVRRCADVGLCDPAWQLGWVLYSYLDRRGHFQENLAVQRTGLDAATATGDADGDGMYHANSGLGRAYGRLGAFDDAERHLGAAMAIARRQGSHGRQGSLHGTLTQLNENRGDHEAALRHAREGLHHMELQDHKQGIAALSNAVGWCSAQLGDYATALPYCERALALVQQIGDVHGIANTWDSIGVIYHGLGRYDEAIRCFHEALPLMRAAGAAWIEGVTLTHLGDAYAAAGDRDRVRHAWTGAVEILDRRGPDAAAEVRAKLAALS